MPETFHHYLIVLMTSSKAHAVYFDIIKGAERKMTSHYINRVRVRRIFREGFSIANIALDTIFSAFTLITQAAIFQSLNIDLNLICQTCKKFMGQIGGKKVFDLFGILMRGSFSLVMIGAYV